MKMKTIFCCFTGFAMAFSLTACGNNHKTAEQKNTAKPAVVKEAPAKAPVVSAAVKGKAVPAGDFASAAAAGRKTDAMMSGGSTGSVVPFANLKITKAKGPDAQTVGELFANRKKLDTKTVTVRGQVVKISLNIMGKNWVHIQDGTGNPKSNTHDLVVTTLDTAAKGDIVTVKGVVEADKDFGAGYKYTVIVEKATLTKDAAAKKAAK
ncbi:MAG: hypothetical protein GXP59_07460 [Deltaproteobacteria bacterium]|nr:hypothetical protein [Deltaproteobacteria bacterium]